MGEEVYYWPPLPKKNVVHEALDAFGDENSYFKVDKWYEDIKEYTFRTKTIPLYYQEALVIKKLCQKNNVDPTEAVSSLLDEEQQHLKSLEQRIDETCKEYIETSGQFFVKLSHRSPKDSVFSLPSMKQMIQDDIAKSTFQGNSPEAIAEDIKIYVRAMSKCLGVKSGAEAIYLLVKSKRVMIDITSIESETAKDIPLSIVLREWNSNIYPEWEFRVFIFNNKLTAAVQYYDILYVAEIAARKDEIKQFIQDYWEKVKGSIKCDTYTMDLAIDPSLTHACIIELNNPPPVAGVSLFNWNNEKDKAQIESGEEFELRIAESLAPEMRILIHPPIRKFMDELRGIGAAPVAPTEGTTVEVATPQPNFDHSPDHNPNPNPNSNPNADSNPTPNPDHSSDPSPNPNRKHKKNCTLS